MAGDPWEDNRADEETLADIAHHLACQAVVAHRVGFTDVEITLGIAGDGAGAEMEIALHAWRSMTNEEVESDGSGILPLAQVAARLIVDVMSAGPELLPSDAPDAVRAVLDAAEDESDWLLTESDDAVEAIAEKLLETFTLRGATLAELIETRRT